MNFFIRIAFISNSILTSKFVKNLQQILATLTPSELKMKHRKMKKNTTNVFMTILYKKSLSKNRLYIFLLTQIFLLLGGAKLAKREQEAVSEHISISSFEFLKNVGTSVSANLGVTFLLQLLFQKMSVFFNSVFVTYIFASKIDC